MGGKRRGSGLKKKMADWWWRQELSPQMAIVLNEIQFKYNYQEWKKVEEHLKKLEMDEGLGEVEEVGNAVRLKIVKFFREDDKVFYRRAFYDALYPLLLEYKFMPLQAMFIWYLRALKLVYGDKPPKVYLDMLRGWVREWLSSGCTKDAEERVKSYMIGWLVGKY
jgi:hypothetical protein